MSEAAAFRVIRARAPRRRHPVARWYRGNERPLLSVAGVLTFFIAWQLGSDAGVIDRFFFSSPFAILAAGANEVQVPRFWDDAKISALELGVGSLAAVVLAVPLGIGIGWFRPVSLTVDPWLDFFNPLPPAAPRPLVLLLARPCPEIE